MAQKTTLQEFEAVWPKLEAVLLEQAQAYKLPQKEFDWYKAVSSRPLTTPHPTFFRIHILD